MQQKSELASRRKLVNFCHIRLACTADNDVLCFLGARGRELGRGAGAPAPNEDSEDLYS